VKLQPQPYWRDGITKEGSSESTEDHQGVTAQRPACCRMD
jgi:hypothetical protein